MGEKTQKYQQGIIAGINIAIGFIPIGMTFGFLAKTTGLTLIEAFLMSGLVFAGASQFLALGLLATTGYFEIILATAILNIRHFLMSASLQKKMEPTSTWTKALVGFGVTDESFSVASIATQTEKTLPASYLLGLNFTAYGSWVLSTVLGFIFGSALPTFLQESMAIALYAMFIGLLVPSMKKNRKVVVLALLGAGFNWLFLRMSWLPQGWSIITATLLSAILTEVFFNRLQRSVDV